MQALLLNFALSALHCTVHVNFVPPHLRHLPTMDTCTAASLQAECKITAGHWPISNHFSKMANQNFSMVHSLYVHGQSNSRRIGKMADHFKFQHNISKTGIIRRVKTECKIRNLSSWSITYDNQPVVSRAVASLHGDRPDRNAWNAR